MDRSYLMQITHPAMVSIPQKSKQSFVFVREGDLNRKGGIICNFCLKGGSSKRVDLIELLR